MVLASNDRSKRFLIIYRKTVKMAVRRIIYPGLQAKNIAIRQIFWRSVVARRIPGDIEYVYLQTPPI
jgi:hypothetical protein